MTDTNEQFDQQLAASAAEKRRNGEKPNREELRAVKRLLRAKDEKSRLDHYRNMPQRDYQRMAGRQAKVINEQAILHGLDISGKTVDLNIVIRQWHDFLARNAVKLRADDVDPILNGPDSPWLEEIRKAEAGLRNIKLERERKTHVNILELKMFLSAAFDILRRTGTDLQRNYGEGAARLFNEGIGRVEERCNAILAAAGPESGAPA